MKKFVMGLLSARLGALAADLAIVRCLAALNDAPMDEKST
jgi:hypothetical protein